MMAVTSFIGGLLRGCGYSAVSVADSMPIRCTGVNQSLVRPTAEPPHEMEAWRPADARTRCTPPHARKRLGGRRV